MTFNRKTYRGCADPEAKRACDRMDSIGLMRELMMVRSAKRRYQLLGRLARRLGFEYRAEDIL